MNMDILYALEKMRTPFLEYLNLGISYIGAEVFAAVAVFIIYWCISKKGGLFVLANIVLGSGLNQTIKLFCHVPRPFVKYEDFTISDRARATAGGYSFPSGHTQNATSLYGSVVVLVKSRTVRILCGVIIALVAFSRMFLGAHYPTDVIGGFCCGLAVLFFVTFLFKRFEDQTWFIPVFFGITGVALTAAGVMFEFGPWNVFASPEEMKDMATGIYMLAGCGLAAAIGVPFERKYVRFETKAEWWAQILKASIGLALFLALVLALKKPANALFRGTAAAYVVRYFVPSLFGICVWPVSFRWFRTRNNP